MLMSVALSASTAAATVPGWFEIKGGTWAADAATVTVMSRDIESAVRSLAGQGFERFAPWAQYKFQYQGRGSNDGRFVLVNAFCNSLGINDVATSFIEVKGGGACYFKVRYDSRTHRFFDLAVNGDA